MCSTTQTDERWMREAFIEAQKAADKGEIPIGAVVVAAGRVIGRGYNLTETLNDVTAHAEMQAITAAVNYIGGKYLKECSLFVTLEPCHMCAGALYWAQIARVVYGAHDSKRGFSLYTPSLLHPSTSLTTGVMETECAALLSDFFKAKR